LFLNDQKKSDPGAVPSERVAELCHRLFDDIDLARLMPGQSYACQDIARRLHARPEEVEAAALVVARGGLVTITDGSLLVAPVDRAYLLPKLDERLHLEQRIAAAAADRSAMLDRTTVSELALLLKRSAQVGDIDGYMAADRRLEKAIAAAAGLPEEAEQLFRLKREFRRAWCAFNRLRDLNRPAQLRQTLVDAVLAGDAQAAKTAVANFIEYLRQSY
jgi:DNA-binding GntR family transcriptional regulator